MLAHHRPSLDPDAITRPDFKHSLQGFKEDAGAILHRSAVLVGSPVGYLMQELLEEVDKSALNLDAVEARVSCDLCGMSEVLHGLPDVVKTHLARGFAHDPAALDVNQLFGIDGGGPKGQPAVVIEGPMRNGALMPELNEDQPACAMNGICNPLPSGALVLRCRLPGLRTNLVLVRLQKCPL